MLELLLWEELRMLHGPHDWVLHACLRLPRDACKWLVDQHLLLSWIHHHVSLFSLLVRRMMLMFLLSFFPLFMLALPLPWGERHVHSIERRRSKLHPRKTVSALGRVSGEYVNEKVVDIIPAHSCNKITPLQGSTLALTRMVPGEHCEFLDEEFTSLGKYHRGFCPNHKLMVALFLVILVFQPHDSTDAGDRKLW